MKVYNKRGNKNYKEKRLLKDLELYIEKRMSEDPNFEKEFIPASNYSELQKMHSRYIVEDANYTVDNESVEAKNNIESKQEINNNMAKKNEEVEDVEFTETTTKSKASSTNSNSAFIDPFNREEPIVRDYVMDGGFKEEAKSEQPQKTYFGEPTSFDEAFDIPEDEEQESEKPSKSLTQSKERPSRNAESLNPNFDEMSAGKKKRSTKKFAKYIVEAVATLSEKGFVWYANKDINESKLTEYEMTREMDLSLLVTLEDGQEVTVKQFFQVQCSKAEMLSKWTEEQKEDLSSALSEVMMEKGIAPTPTQELILVTLTIIGGQAMTLLTLKSQTNSLLNQLRSMNDGNQPIEQTYTEPPMPTPTPQSVPKNEDEDFSDKGGYVPTYEEPQINDDFEMFNEIAEMTEEEVLISDQNIETKE
jgi:hypothetical protein